MLGIISMNYEHNFVELLDKFQFLGDPAEAQKNKCPIELPCCYNKIRQIQFKEEEWYSI